MRNILLILTIFFGCNKLNSIPLDQSYLFEGNWSKIMTITYFTPAPPDTNNYLNHEWELHFVLNGIWDQYLNLHSYVKHYRWHYWVQNDSLIRSYDGQIGFFLYNIDRKDDTLFLWNNNFRHILVPYVQSNLPVNWPDSIISINMDSLSNL